MATQFETHGSVHVSDWYRMQLEQSEDAGTFGSPIVAMEAWYSSDEYQELLRRGE